MALKLSISVLQKELVSFDGERDSLSKFISVSEKALEMCKEEERKLLFELIKMKLNGKAYNLTKNRTLDTWEKLKVFLQELFSEKRSQGQWEMELHSCKQKNQESVIDFANRLENIMVKLIDSVSSGVEKSKATIYEELIREQTKNVFLTGLNEPINILVKSQGPRTLQAAVELAVSEERELASKRETQKYKRESCQLCGRNNHLARDCFQLKQNKHILSIQPEKKVCRYCKKTGHLIEECRTREENNKRRQQGKPSNYQGKNNGVRNNGPHLNQKHLSESGEPKDVSSLRAANN